MTILKGKEPKDVIAIFVIALVISILVYLAVITAFPKETYYFNEPSINETVRKIDVQLNFQVYVNDKLVVNKWNNGLTRNFFEVLEVAFAQNPEVSEVKDINGNTYTHIKYFYYYCTTCENDYVAVRLGLDTYSSEPSFDIYALASTEQKQYKKFPSASVNIGSDNVTITYTWEITASETFTFYEVGITRMLIDRDTSNVYLEALMLYEDIPEGVSVEADDVIKIVLKFICEKSSDETFTVKFASEFLDKIFKEDYTDTALVWSAIQYRYIEIGKDCFSTNCADNGEICSTNYIELHHETRTYYTNADKTQCTIELKVTYTPSENVNVKEVCWGFSNTNVGYCKKFDTTLQKDVPYVIKVLLTFPTG